MHKFSIAIAVSATLIFAMGCTNDKESVSETVQSVEWYKEHKMEREEVVASCRKIPEQIGSKPNCLNAIKARDAVSLGAKRLQLQPLTKEQLREKGIGTKPPQNADAK